MHQSLKERNYLFLYMYLNKYTYNGKYTFNIFALNFAKLCAVASLKWN